MQRSSTNRIRVDRRPVGELTDAQIERLMDLGRREAALIDEMEGAIQAGDRDLVWQIAIRLCRLGDELEHGEVVKADIE
jgi:hypothetical protein